MGNQKSFRDRCKENWKTHKKKVYIVGGVVLGVAGGYALIKNLDSMLPLVEHGIEKIEHIELSAEPLEVSDTIFAPPLGVVSTIKEVPVKAHIMNLPNGKHASEAGKALALELNVVLSENQTMRKATTRHIAA